MFKRLLLGVFFLIFFAPKITLAQGGVTQPWKTDFAWEVKQIDEFMERFNGDSTLIQDFLQKLNTAKLTRTSLIKSLLTMS